MDDTRILPMPQLTACPQCAAPAEIVRRTVLESTDGPIEHAAVRCVARHHFVLPTSQLDHDAAHVTPVTTTTAHAAEAAAPRARRRR
ncbi:MAG TPA: hypothetical protein VFZ70_18525 [Euzebyales bacterium]